MFVAVLFPIAKMWKQLKCPSIGKWVKKSYTYTMEYYLAMKNEIVQFTTVWVEVKRIMLSQISQRKTNTV